ncbi:MAG: HAMP domain-containing sensor histidine kinase [Emcibacteraceae bacterium]|nr:HAMP domain-containing sensor histidine kinase [Emcibacteraceae bacterium]
MSLNNEQQEINYGKRRPLWLRLVTISAVWTILALVIGGYLLSVVFRDTLEQNFDDRLNSMLENLIGISFDDDSTELNFSRTMVDPRFEQPYSGWYWQISPEGFNPLRSRSLWDVNLDVNFDQAVPNTQTRDTLGPEGQLLRLIERDITIANSDVVYRFVVAIDTAEITEQENRFDNILLIGMSALGIGLMAASLMQVFLGLRPLAHVKETLGQVRSGEKDYLPNDFPSEIQPLADELNALIDHNNEIIERSRTQVGNLAHALKTPIAVLRNEARMNDGGEHSAIASTVAKQTENMHKHVEHYLKRARAAANVKTLSGHSLIMPSIHSIARALNKINDDKTIEVRQVENEHELVFKGEVNDFQDMVGNLMENAAKWATSIVIVECEKQNKKIIIKIKDDGTGIDAAARDAVFARGERLDEKKPGTGLGLSIVKDLAGLYNGTIELSDNPKADHNKGLIATLTLPSV